MAAPWPDIQRETGNLPDYLDGLVASRSDSAMPVWNDYYPAQKAYYEGLA